MPGRVVWTHDPASVEWDGNGSEILLTAKEYDIFCLLVANKNRVLTYDQIYEKVWDDFSSGGERKIHISENDQKTLSQMLK